MEGYRILEIKKSVFENNDREADLLREQLKKDRTFLLNLMSSPGSGKTTTLKATIAALKDEFRIGVMEADVGNLVCPAEFDTGSVKNAMILSVPEGDDKPLKYPLMFSICDVLLINKIDVLPYFDFDIEACRKYVHKLNPNMKIIPISARNGEGIDEWAQWLREQIHAWND